MPKPELRSSSTQKAPTALRRWAGAVLCAEALAACTPAGGGAFSEALQSRLAERPAEIDLANVARFAWDELYALAPYSTREDNCRRMRMEFLECRTTVPETVGEGEYFLVFRAKGKVVRAERHARQHGDFAGAGTPLPQPVLRSAARFKVIVVDSRVRLEHVTPTS